jgi:hypothetical protein
MMLSRIPRSVAVSLSLWGLHTELRPLLDCGPVVDVFIVFHETDAAQANAIKEALEATGFQCALATSDQRDFRNSSETALDPAVVVLWSRASVASPVIQDQALRALMGLQLVPVKIEKGKLPPGDLRSAASLSVDLRGWQGDPRAGNFPLLVRVIPGMREQALRMRRDATTASVSSAPGPSTPSPILTAIRNSQTGRPATPPPSFASPPPSTVSQAGTLFICYRRDDTQGEAGRLHDLLTATFGDDSVIMDVESVPLGIDYVDHISQQIGHCAAVVVMIGRQWLTITDKRGCRRLDDREDLVRMEIAAALKQKVPVIPVLVQNAAMPDREDLPDDIRLLARRNGIALRHDQWREGVDRLLKDLKSVIGHAAG